MPVAPRTGEPPTLYYRYAAPPGLLVRGRVFCLYRKSWCNVIGFTDAPIPWPIVRRQRSLGGRGLLVNKTMLRAIRFESASALMYHFGVGSHAVWNWRRKFLGNAGKFATRGSRVLHMRASRAGAEAIKAKEWTAEELARKAAASKGRRPVRWTPERGGWTPAESKLLDALPDAEVAAKTGRTVDAVRAKRRRTPRLYRLLGPDGSTYESTTPGLLGGNRRLRIYGRLDCPSALAALPRGYARHRVFFKDEAAAIAAGYRPCGKCMRAEYAKWRAPLHQHHER